MPIRECDVRGRDGSGLEILANTISAAYHVLLVEDSPAEVEEFARKTRKGPVQIRFSHAATLLDAQRLYDSIEFDAIVLGLNQAGEEGLNLVSAIVAFNPLTPVVVLAATFDDDTAVEALAHGAEEYLLKGECDGSAIARAIRYAVLRVEAQRENLRLNEELRQIQEHLIQSARMEAVGQLAAGVAHEIKNPLGILTFCLKFLRDADPNDERVQMIYARMDNAVNRADLLLSEMLDFAKPRAVRVAVGSIEAPIRKAIDLTSHRLKEKGAVVEWEIAPEVPTFAFDDGKLTQALINLISNAFDAVPNRTGRILIRAGYRPPRRRPGASGPAAVLVTVTDNGSGVPQAMLDRIFDPFFTTKGLGSGYGLGLSIVQRIAQMHNGSARVENAETGAVATLELPVVKRVSTRKPAP